MQEEATREGLTAQDLERRVMPRCAVDEDALLLLVGRGARVNCRIVELSLSGCRMSTTERLPAVGELRVEATFKVQGIAFRFGGVIEWADGNGLVGIRFVELIPRRRDELIEVLRELEVEIAAKAEKEAARKRAEESRAGQEAEKLPPGQTEAQPSPKPASEPIVPVAQPWRNASPPIPRNLMTLGPLAASPQEPQPHPLEQGRQVGHRPATPAKRERRIQSRHEVDTSAIIFLVNVGARLSGRIQDLSMGGCRIRTEERFPVGIYTRVETEFRLEGLPFRLGGVIQAVHDRDRRLVGIRFLDMSARKREQLEQLIEEIEEMQGKQNIAKPERSGETAVERPGPESASQASAVLRNAAAADQVEDQNDDRNDDQKVDQGAANMEAETQEPQNQKNYKERPEHNFSFAPRAPRIERSIQGSREV
jgi:c-di-GMP-binding flagellar brake protein YcgR